VQSQAPLGSHAIGSAKKHSTAHGPTQSEVVAHMAKEAATTQAAPLVLVAEVVLDDAVLLVDEVLADPPTEGPPAELPPVEAPPVEPDEIVELPIPELPVPEPPVEASPVSPGTKDEPCAQLAARMAPSVRDKRVPVRMTDDCLRLRGGVRAPREHPHGHSDRRGRGTAVQG
jgi:hypothetical protein